MLHSGAVVQYISYDEFGNILTNTNPGFQPFGYAGGLYDGQTCLVRFGARDYNAPLGRWTAKDPIGFEGKQLNVYIYVQNNPLNLIDYSGLWITIPILDQLSPNSGHYGITEYAIKETPLQSEINNIMMGQYYLDLVIPFYYGLDIGEFHYTGDPIKTQSMINSLLKRAIEQSNCGNDKDALFTLGIMLHMVQDYWAHSEPRQRHHTNGGKAPHEDNREYYEENYQNAINQSYVYVKYFLSKTNK